jgi:hypothetical protein
MDSTDENEKYKFYVALFENYKNNVESGNYDSHSQMIKLYNDLLEKVHPVDTQLRNLIMEEIEAHECDEMTDRM